ncbi:MAG: alpha-xylosidase [Armatimonadota bacterium]
MKFTDGNWLMRQGVRAHYPAQAYDVAATEHLLTIEAPTKRINHRGDTLGGPVLTVQFSSPMPDVIRVHLTHYSGKKPHGPEFEIFPSAENPAQTSVTDTTAVLTSGQLSVEVSRSGWDVSFKAGGKTITRSGNRGMGLAEVEGEGKYLHEQLALGVGENVYGLGERFTALVKNGQVVESWNKDGGTGSDQAYKNVPFYLTNRGYGVFVNHPENVSFEVASEKVSRVQFSVPGDSLEYFVIYGPTPKEVLEKYTALTGRPALPPAWSFGLWLTTSFTTSYDEKTVTGILDQMVAHDLPLHVFHFDCFWMREFHWCDFEWDPRTFPDPEGMLGRLHERGLKVCVWINPYIAQRSKLFAEGAEHGYLLKTPGGDVWQTDLWQPGMGIVDFTNPDACRWFGDKLRVLCDSGVDSFKTDFGERIPTDDVAWFDGSDPQRMHNYYSFIYNKVVFDVLKEKRGENEAAVFARSATAGGQQFPVHWGGDCYSSFESMAESLRGGLSLSLSGFGFWSHDIGGFEGTPPIEVYKRWIAFGLLSSHSRLHGSSSYRVPWLFDEEAVDVLRFFTKLKCRLMPYLYGQSVVAHEQGIPTMRAMMLEFPQDPSCDTLDRQYMLGESLLVAPIFSPDGTAQYYLPAGRWTKFLTGEVVVGPRWVQEAHDFLSVPLLVRSNSLIAVGGTDTKPDYDFSEDVTLHLYELEEGKSATAAVPTLAGMTEHTVTATRQGNEIRVTSTGGAQTWSLLLVGIDSAASVDGGAAEQTQQGIRLTIGAGTETLSIRLNQTGQQV